MTYLNHARHVYHQFQIGTNHPCSEEQVMALERSLGCSLPLAYKEFLFWMGLGAGPFLRGSRCFYNDLLAIQAGATHMLPIGASSERLPEKSFVFWMHQGYQFLFFRLQDGDDPPVHYYNQGENARRIIFNQYDSFSKFLSQEVIGHAQLSELIAGIPAGLRRFSPRADFDPSALV